jgi:hypothetical protein
MRHALALALLVLFTLSLSAETNWRTAKLLSLGDKLPDDESL